ncbi:hypothetical protein HU200_038840 [Digitaria exilis]|uniref:Translocon Sec61/SecY plug domain-containing protein n=1 Tax=Digitaria exilis TaxID=1010633 RepID=A0A835BBP1_9POAL|nr:hypothetical protein HU200_038840 [Digitaria exilis]
MVLAGSTADHAAAEQQPSSPADLEGGDHPSSSSCPLSVTDRTHRHACVDAYKRIIGTSSDSELNPSPNSKLPGGNTRKAAEPHADTADSQRDREEKHLRASSSTALDLIRPLASRMPSVRRPDREVSFHHRALYTGLSVSIFMVCSHLPLYGVRYASMGADPLYWLRSILSSNRGTLMELGVGPVVTAGTLFQLASTSGLLRFDHNVREDRDLADGARKVLALVIALGEAAAHVLLGMYGPHVGALNGVLIVLQLISATAVVVYLDDVLEKGYGLKGSSSAISLFSAANTCGKVFWQAFSPVTVNTGRGPEFEGVVLAVAHRALTRTSSARAVVATLLRRHLPNATNLAATFLVLLAAVYLEGVQMLVPLTSRDRRGRRGTFPIKLLYTSTMPIVLYTAVVSALYLVSQLLHYSRLGGTLLVRLLGVWAEASHAAVPVGGLAYYVTPPASFAGDPVHALVYVALMLASCALLAQGWVVASESSARDVARRIADQRMGLPGRRDGATYAELRRYIPTAAALGGLCVGALTIFADMTGVIGTGTGIMLAATAVYNLVKSVEKEDEALYI